MDDRHDKSHLSGDVIERNNDEDVINKNNDRDDNVKEGKPLQRKRSNSFDKNSRRITAKINRFQQLNEQNLKDREKDRNSNYLLHKDGTKNKVEKFEKEIESQESPAKKDNSVRSPKFKEVSLWLIFYLP